MKFNPKTKKEDLNSQEKIKKIELTIILVQDHILKMKGQSHQRRITQVDLPYLKTKGLKVTATIS